MTNLTDCTVLPFRKPFQSSVLHEYMQFFVFTDMRLDSAFRKLCSKLYFKAEAQQIDRILESFANRYWDCNRDSLFGSAGMLFIHIYRYLEILKKIRFDDRYCLCGGLFFAVIKYRSPCGSRKSRQNDTF